MIEANPDGLVQWNPAGMKKYGTVDDAFGGGNLYRLIFAASRKVTLILDIGPVTLPLYAAVEPLPNPNVWVLEKWMPGEKVAPVSKEEWNAVGSEWLRQGPYPEKGDYVMAGLPLTCDPASANIEKLITWIEAGKKFTPAQNAIALQNNIDAAERAKDAKRKDMIENQLLPFGGEAWASGNTKGRGTKNVTLTKSANELGLPTKSGYSGISPVHQPVTYKVKLDQEQ